MTYCLIVDDSAVIRKVAKHIVEGLQFETNEAEDGSIALAKMPSKDARRCSAGLEYAADDGIQFIKALRQEKNGDQPKVIFCTTENDMEHISMAIEAGADEFVMKPFDKSILEAKFQQVGLID